MVRILQYNSLARYQGLISLCHQRLLCGTHSRLVGWHRVDRDRSWNSLVPDDSKTRFWEWRCCLESEEAATALLHSFGLLRENSGCACDNIRTCIYCTYIYIQYTHTYAYRYKLRRQIHRLDQIIYIHMHMYIHTYIQMHISRYIHMHIDIYTCTYIYTHAHRHIYQHMCIYT